MRALLDTDLHDAGNLHRARLGRRPRGGNRVTRPAKKPRTGPRARDAILVRLSPEERAEIREAAERDERPVGAWLRVVALRAARAG